MARSREVQERFADLLGLDLKRVMEVTARIRPHGFFVTETKSKLSHRVNARHCANLLYVLMMDVPANHAPEAIRRAEGIWFSREDIPSDPVFTTMFGGLLNKLRKEHLLLDGIETMFEMAAKAPDLFEYLFSGMHDGEFSICNYGYAEFNFPIRWGRINRLLEKGPTEWEDLKAAGIDGSEHFHVHYESEVNQNTELPKMSRTTMIFSEFFLEIGKMLASDTS